MKVSELIELLKQQNPNDIVEIPAPSYGEDGEMTSDIELENYEDGVVMIKERW